MLMDWVRVCVHPVPLPPVTVYCVEAVGIILIVPPVIFPGSQEYVLAPVALYVTELPAHKVCELATTVMVGVTRTFMASVLFPAHPNASVPVTE